MKEKSKVRIVNAITGSRIIGALFFPLIISQFGTLGTAIYIGTLCSVAYLSVYFARNILGAVTPQMIEAGYAEKYIGKVSSFYFVFYALGQLINGAIGDKIKTRYMVSIGLLMAGVTNVAFSRLSSYNADIAVIAYGFTGFFLAMIYGPITKVVAENTEPIYATRCNLGYTFTRHII